MPKALVLAGTKSGCGKTSVALGLMRALSRRGLLVQPFKAGPDFIDPGLHQRACGRESHNLDTWMQPAEALSGLFVRHAARADIAIVEGVMGLFDGQSGGAEEGSTAHLAKLLGLPVILVADAASRARSAAAEVLGFDRFDPALRLAGAVLNRVGSERHEAALRAAMAALPDVPLLGCLPGAEGIGLASRHLGLVTAGEAANLEARLEALAHWVEAGLDLPRLLAALPELDLRPPDDPPPPRGKAVRIGLARDRAFCFTYAENLRLLEAAGAVLVPFSPMTDAALPPGLHGLLLPGGYPELAAAELAANEAMRESVRAFCASGRPAWAECGGYMYLLETLRDLDGQVHAMCGALPGTAVMLPRRAALGYRTAATLAPGPLGPAGTVLRGHEFHYSRLDQPAPDGPAFALADSAGGQTPDGAARGNIVAGYFHAHLSSNPEVARRFVEACRQAGA